MKRGIILTLFLSIVKYSSCAQLDPDGGYANVIVTLSPNLNYSQATQLKDFFSQVSRQLYDATFDHVFIKSVVIVVPDSWSTTDVSSEFHRADIKIDYANNLFPGQSVPHTQQPRSCGEKGNFIYLTTEYIEKWNINRDEVLITKFIQEWAKLRYGVFEETGSKTSAIFPDTYLDAKGKKKKTGCASPDPWISTKCETVNGIENCKGIELDRTLLPARTSIMGDSSLKPRIFCGDSVDKLHNSLAPTRHNALCRSKSTWEVINKNSDFTDFSFANNKPKNRIPLQTFTFVKRPPLVFVIVVDPNLCRPESSLTKYNQVWLAVLQFITFLPQDAKIGFVLASSKSENIPITTLQDFINKKKDLLALIIPKYSYIKNWKKSLDLTMKMQEDFKQPMHLILLADGRNPDFPSTEIERKLQNNFITLLLLTFAEAGPTMPVLTSESLKMFLDYPNSLWFNILFSTETTFGLHPFRSSINDAFTEYFNRFVKQELEFKDIKITTVMNTTGSFKIRTNDTIIEFKAFCSPIQMKANLNVNGKEFTDLIIDSETNILTFQWNPLNSSTGQFEFNNDSYCSSTSLWSIANPIYLSGQIVKPMNIHLPYILYGFCPKCRSMAAEITFNGISQNIQLRDNGNGDPDVKFEDGIFSRYFIYPNMQPGTHSIWLLAIDDANETILRTYLGTYSLPSIDLTYTPPNWIGDFHLQQIDPTNEIATFQWTAPGRNCDHSAADSYFLNCATDLSTSWNKRNGFKLETAPKESGELETLNWKIPSGKVLHYCRIWAENENSQSEISNIAHVYLKSSTRTTIRVESSTVVHSTMTSASEASQKDCPEIPTGPIVGGIVGVIIIVAILNAIIWYLIYKRLGRLSKRCKSNFELNATKASAPTTPAQPTAGNQYNSTPKPQPEAAANLAEVLKESIKASNQNHAFATSQVDDGPIYDDVAEDIYEEIDEEKIEDEFYDDVNV